MERNIKFEELPSISLSTYAKDFLDIQFQFNKALNDFLDPISGLFDEAINPHHYAVEPYSNFVQKYLNGSKSVLFLGMNAGPNGMAKYGIPFGDIVSIVKWLKISGNILRNTYDSSGAVIQKQISIQSCLSEQREESGKRLWSFLEELNETPENFFANCFIHNYCPLSFSKIASSGKSNNVTPETIKIHDKKWAAQLEEVCDQFLEQTIRYLKCHTIVAIGRYAEKKALRIVKQMQKNAVSSNQQPPNIRVVEILHPSPSTRKSNETWRKTVRGELEKDPELFRLIANRNKQF